MYGEEPMKRIQLILVSASLIAFSCSEEPAECKNTALSGCNTAPVSCVKPTSCEPADGANIEVLCPASGAVFKPGDSLEVYWRAKVGEFSGFRPQISLNGGTDFLELADTSVWFGTTPSSQCISYKIVVPKDGSFTPEGSDNANVLVRVRDYNATQAIMRDNSSLFTILKSE